MRINDDQPITGVAMALDAIRRDQPDQSFADLLDAERLKAETEAARSEILAGQGSEKQDPNKQEYEFIREHGLRAYAEEIHKKKMEELREKLLEAMGLSEEDLEEMPADQRLIIENMISREIQNRMAANAVINGDAEPGAAAVNPSATGNAGPGNLLAAQILAGDPGTMTGLIIEDAASDPKPFDGRRDEPEDR